MKSKAKKLSLIMLIAVSSPVNVRVNAQTAVITAGAPEQEVISIKGIRFVDALLEKWITAPETKLLANK